MTGRVWLYVVPLLAGLALGWLANGWRLSGELATLRAEHATHLATQQQASADVISRTLLRERELREEIEENEKNAQTEKAQLERDLADSNHVAERMQKQLSDLSGRISADTAAEGECAAARATAGVLTDMLAGLDEAAGVYAETADRARIAGEGCEADYEGARRSQTD